MFTFINASILAFTAAIAIPLFIHLFNKQRKKKVKFSSIRFLQILEKQRLKRIKIYDYILILLRTLIILTLILAFARPTLTNNSFFSSKNARTTSVIIIDDGINMSRYDEMGSRYLRANSVLNRLMEKFNPEDEIFVLRSSSPDKIINKQVSIQETNGSFVHGKWDAALKNSMKIFEDNPNFNQELHIISDFQFEEETFESLLPEFNDIRIFLIQIGSGFVTNLGIKTVDIKNQIFEVNKPLQLETQIINTTPENTEPVEVHLFVDQQRVAHRRVSVDPYSVKNVPLSFSPKTAGHLSGYVEISDDDLLADNRYYFALKIPSEIKLLFIDDTPSIFLKAALKSLTDQTNLKITMERYNSWARQNFLSFDILVLSNFSVLTPANLERLKKYLNNGGAIFFIPGMRTTPVEFTRMAANLGFSLVVKGMMSTNKENEFYYLKQPNLNHPIFSGLFRTEDPELSKPRFFKYLQFSVSSKDQIILSYQNNDPFLVQAKHKTGSIFVMSSYVDDSWTDIQYRGIYIPLLSRILYFGASHASQIQPSTLAAQEKIVTINAISPSGNFYLQSPDKEKAKIVPRQLDQNFKFYLNNTNTPGMYHLYADNKIISSVPVNPETYAIHKSYIDIESVVDFENALIFSENDNFEESIIQARFGSELWKLFIILTLILLAIELFVIKKMEGKVKAN